MGKFLESIAGFVETVVGPSDWEKGNRNGCETFTGKFLVYDRRGIIRLRVRGWIVQRRWTADVYLYDPPRFVSRHVHGPCLQLLNPNDKWFKLHFSKQAENFVEAYTYVEHMLTEAYNQTH